MKKKQNKRKPGLGLSAKINQLSKKSCPLAKKSESELNYKNLKLLKKYLSLKG